MRRIVTMMLLTVSAALIALRAPAQTGGTEALCAGKGTIDEVKPIPLWLVGFATKLYGQGGDVVYRCMDDHVWLCSYGANLPCGGKADARRNNPGVIQYCRENPNDPFVPMVASGHATVYSWKCARGKPVITSVEKVDARGFIAHIWTLAQGVQ
jgi:hypothetical protein